MYNKLILIFLLFIIIFYFLNFKKETFSDDIKSNKNIFVSDNYDTDKINVDRLCIRNEKNEIECISKEELFNAVELPNFRKHTICIDDACIRYNDLKKINGESDINFESGNSNVCLNLSDIEGESVPRKKWLWETGNNYDSKNEPDDGWYQRGKRCKTNCRLCTNFGKDGKSDGLDRYGCGSKHTKFWKACWRSAGRKCHSRRELKRKSIKFGKRRDKWYKLEGRKLGDDIPVLNGEPCGDTTKFYINEGDKLEDINLYNKYRPKNIYSKIDIHDTHLRIGEK